MWALPNIGIGSGPGICMANLYDSVELRYRWMVHSVRSTTSNINTSISISHISLLVTDFFVKVWFQFNWVETHSAQSTLSHYTQTRYNSIVQWPYFYVNYIGLLFPLRCSRYRLQWTTKLNAVASTSIYILEIVGQCKISCIVGIWYLLIWYLNVQLTASRNRVRNPPFVLRS